MDLHFSSHNHLPPSVPILPEVLPTGSLVRLSHERLQNPLTLQYTNREGGLPVIGEQTSRG